MGKGVEITAMKTERQPTGADLSCAICRKPGPSLDFDHIQNRGAGGSKERDVPANKIPLCRPCHLAKTVGTIKTWVKDGVYHWRKRDSDLVFRIPVEVSERYGCLVPTGTGDPNVTLSGKLPGGRSSVPVAGEGVVPSPQVALEYPLSPSLALAGPGLLIRDDDGGTAGPARMDAEGADLSSNAAPLTPSAFSLAEGCRQGMQLLYWGLKIKDTTDEWRWRIGDWLVRMEEELGEPAYQYFEPLKEAFGYDAIRQYKSVAERVTRVTREPELPWSHHRAVASLGEKAQRAALITAREEGLSSREMAVLVRPAAPERERCICPTCKHEHYALVAEEWK